MSTSIEILHIFNDQKKFSKDFFLFLQANEFDLNKHYLFHYGKDDGFYKTFPMAYCFGGGFFSIIGGIKLFFLLLKSRKIVVHSLASPFLIFYLWLFPFLNDRVYWVIWGKDLYFYRTLENKRFYHYLYEFFRKKVIRNIKNIVTHVDGDYELAKEWYGTDARWIECFIYPSNLYKELHIDSEKSQSLSILMGNSADPSNEHIEMFKYLTNIPDHNFKIYCPLSYGEGRYAKQIAKRGEEYFGENFIPLMDFIPFEEYMRLLSKIDIAAFNHKRQQAFGTKVTLLGGGKKVYMSRESNLWGWFSKKSIKVFDIECFNTDPIDTAISEKNIDIVKNYFSEEQLKNTLRLWLE